jgi:hypothetical protein
MSATDSLLLRGARGFLPWLLAGALLTIAVPASARTYHPTRTDDPKPNGCKKKDCSLREAVIAFNALGFEQKLEAAIVLRPGARYKLTRKGAGEDDGQTGDLDVSGVRASYFAPQWPVVKTKKKRGAKPAIIDGNDIDRVFDGSLTLSRVVLRDGHARVGPGDDGDGGAARAGLTMFSPTFAGLGRIVFRKGSLVSNVAEGNGGALQSALDLDVEGTKLKGNRAAGNGGAVDFAQTDCDGPEGGASISGSRVVENSAGGEGGALYGHGCGAFSVQGSFLGENRAVGPGGAISGRVFLFESTLARNSSQGYGGGLALPPRIERTSTVDRSTISGNSANRGGGIGSFTESPGDIAPPVPGLQVQDSTITNNRADRDGGGVVAFGDATVNLDFVTVARNVANTGQHGGSQGPGRGGGLFQEVDAVISVRSTIVALNTRAGTNPAAEDCYTFASAGFASLGHNLLGTTLDCPGFGAAGDLVGGKLGLAELAGNGGPTKTIALKKGSRAIGNADPVATPPGSGASHRDQRGVKRDGKPDIGAYERVKKKKK